MGAEDRRRRKSKPDPASVLDLEAHRHPAQARAPNPASTVLITLDINSRWPTHARRLLIRFRHYILEWSPPGRAVRCKEVLLQHISHPGHPTRRSILIA